MPFSTYLGQAILNHVAGIQEYSMPAGLKLSLHTGDPGLTGLNEVTGGTYQRQTITLGSLSGKTVISLIEAVFEGMPEQIATPVSYGGIWDNASNFLFPAQIVDGNGDPITKVCNAGDTMTVPAGQLLVELDPA